MGQIHKEEANRSWKVHTYWHTWPTSMYLKAHGYWTCDYDIFTCDGRKGICFMWQKGHLKKWHYKFGAKKAESSS